MDIFSARLKFTREKTKFSKKEVAEMVGMSPQGYGKLELGTREPNLQVLAMFPHILNESTDFLLGVTDFDKKATKYYDDYIHLITKIQLTLNRIEEIRESEFPDRNNGSAGMLIASNESIIKIYLEGVKSDEGQKEYLRKRLFKHLESIPFVSEKTFDYVNNQAEETTKRLFTDRNTFR